MPNKDDCYLIEPCSDNVEARIAVDPGSKESAFAIFSPSHDLVAMAKVPNLQLVNAVWQQRGGRWAEALWMIELPQPRGQTMFRQLVDTIRFIGWLERCIYENRDSFIHVDRRDVINHLIPSGARRRLPGIKANGQRRPRPSTDSLVRKAVIRHYGGDPESKSRKDLPEVLRDAKADCWQAIAVGLTVFGSAAKIIG